MSSKEKEIIKNSSEKKTYTPPILTKYGKLAEITAGGGLTGDENDPKDEHGNPWRRS